jgi:hypothetical protein
VLVLERGVAVQCRDWLPAVSLGAGCPMLPRAVRPRQALSRMRPVGMPASSMTSLAPRAPPAASNRHWPQADPAPPALPGQPDGVQRPHDGDDARSASALLPADLHQAPACSQAQAR